MDREVLRRLRDVHADWLDALGELDDVLFRPTPTVAAALVLALFLWRAGPRWSWCAPAAIGVTILVEVIIKNGWRQVLHVRALLDGLLVLVGGHFHSAAPFPSGHVARAFFLSTLVLAFLPRRVAIPLALLAFTTPVARVYTEDHRLSEVLGGATLGVAVGSGAVWMVLFLARRTKGSIGVVG